MPYDFETTPDGLLMAVNGMDAPLKWDGISPTMDTVGVTAPTAALTLAGSGVGSIVGTYTAYTRFLDADGNPSNLSTVSSEVTMSGATGTITGASNASPIVITSAGHGLTTGDVVKITGVGGNVSANNTWTITYISGSTFSLDNSSGTADYTGGGTWTSGVSTITYSSIPVPTETKVTRRQVIRNTDGQSRTYYVDLDTTDLTSTSLSSTKTDSVLSVQTAVSILDSDGKPLANRYGLPPNHKSAISFHLGRMFMAVDVEYTQGSVMVTFGSLSVTGVGTEFTSAMAGRFLWVVGGDKGYEISSVNTTTQVLTLLEAYKGPTNLFAVYAVRPAPAEHRLIYFSESNLPEAWPAANAFELQADDDEITGLMQMGSFLYILEQRHIYRFSYQSDPSTDGFMFLSSNRGCINQRCWVVVEDAAYMLDEQGIHVFQGGESEPLTLPIQDIFRDDNTEFRLHWQASKWWHAAHFPAQEAIRWYVTMSGEDLPRHALVFQYRLKRWWIEEYQTPIGCSCTFPMPDYPRVLLGGDAKRVWCLWKGSLDGPDPDAGTTRGSVTSSTLTTIVDTAATFASSGLVGNPVSIVKGMGKGQTRIVASVSGTTINVSQPWLVKPDTTSVYQLGGIYWLYRSRWHQWVADENLSMRRFQLVFSPLAHTSTMDMRIFKDFGTAPRTWSTTYSSGDAGGVASTQGSIPFVLDLTKSNGYLQKRMEGRKEILVDGWRFLQMELRGYTSRDAFRMYSMAIDGAQG